jgi:hypothetical protein
MGPGEATSTRRENQRIESFGIEIHEGESGLAD